MEEMTLQMFLPFVLTFAAGMVAGGTIVFNHYRHRDEVKEAYEKGQRDERLRKAPPTKHEEMLRLLSALSYNDHVKSYDVKTDDGTFTYTETTNNLSET